MTATILEIIGAATITVGVAVLSLACGLIVAGIFVILFALALER